MPDRDPTPIFEFFTEIGIIEQLSRANLEAQLPDGLIAPHFKVLNHLSRVKDGQTPLAMAQAFQVPKTSLTHTLQVLERRGLVEARPHPEDGRSKQVWLTAAGHKLRAETIGKLAANFAQFAAGFDLSKLVEIKPVLTELRKFMDERRGS